MKLRLRKVETPTAPSAPTRLVEKHSTFKWTRGADVQSVWRRHGWQPPSEYRNDYLFKTNREMALND